MPAQISNGKRLIADVYGDGRKERETNVRLIATAPMGYELAQLVCKLVTAMRMEDEFTEYLDPCEEKAIAILAAVGVERD